MLSCKKLAGGSVFTKHSALLVLAYKLSGQVLLIVKCCEFFENIYVMFHAEAVVPSEVTSRRCVPAKEPCSLAFKQL